MQYSKDMNQTAMIERKLSRQERVRALSQKFAQTPPVDKSRRVSELEAEIASYERNFGMTTADMQAKICLGQVEEAGSFGEWNRKARLLRGHLHCAKTG
jgi:hypothetical protein